MEKKREMVVSVIVVADHAFAIRVDSLPLGRRLYRLFQHFPSGTSNQMFSTVAISQSPAGFDLTIHGPDGLIVVGDHFCGSDVETWVKGRIVCALFRMRGRKIIGLHGSAFAYAGAAYLVVGASGVGKTTLTALACETGAQYISDDIVLIDTESGQVFPYPILMSLKSPEQDGQTSFELDGVGVSKRAVAHIGSWLFPSYDAAGSCALLSLSLGEVLKRILSNFRNAPVFGPTGIDRIAQLARRAPAYQLVSNSLSSASAFLTEVLNNNLLSAETVRKE